MEPAIKKTMITTKSERGRIGCLLFLDIWSSTLRQSARLLALTGDVAGTPGAAEMPQTPGMFVAMAMGEPTFHGLSCTGLRTHAAHVAITNWPSVPE